MRKIIVGKKYRHFKGNIYRVLNIAIDTETLTKRVIYENVETKQVWDRGYEMFVSKVDRKKYPEAKAKYRYEEMDE